MITKTQEQILALLLSSPGEMLTIRGIARALKKSYALVYNNISDLENKSVIRKEDVPPAKTIRFNESVPDDLLIEIELNRRHELLLKYSWIKVMLDDILRNSKDLFFVLIVFGSYAKGKQTSGSDIDLLAIVQADKDIRRMEDAVLKTYTKIKKSINVVDIRNFKEMIMTKEMNIGNEAMKNHIIIHGVETYYQLIK